MINEPVEPGSVLQKLLEAIKGYVGEPSRDLKAVTILSVSGPKAKISWTRASDGKSFETNVECNITEEKLSKSHGIIEWAADVAWRTAFNKSELTELTGT